MTTPDQDPAGRTPDAPEVDQPDGGASTDGKTPANPDNDMPEGGDDT